MPLAFGSTNQITANAENVARLPGKTTTQTTMGLKRPALGEIGNTLDRFAVPSLQHGAKKTQGIKTMTYCKDQRKFTKVLQSEERHLSKASVSSSSLFSVTSVQQEAKASSVTTGSYSTDILKEYEDVDKDDRANPLLVASYAPDIYRYLLELEQVYPVKENFLAEQDISPKMRATLVDWLVDVQEQYKLIQETLFLTISIIDRYLQGVSTDRKQLQLVGVAALFIAAKYEEIYCIDVGELVFVTDNAYSKKDVLQMEKKILKELDFDLGKPLSLHFLRRFSKVAKVLPIHHNFAKYFLEWALMDYQLSHIRPSRLAAAALFIAKCIYGKKDTSSRQIWNQALEHFSGVPLAEVQATAVKMAKVLQKAQTSKFQAVERKYSSSKLMKVSQRPEMTSDAFKILASGVLP